MNQELTNIIAKLTAIINGKPILEHIAGNVYESDEGDVYMLVRNEQMIKNECEENEYLSDLVEFYDRQGFSYEYEDESLVYEGQTLADVGMSERDFW